MKNLRPFLTFFVLPALILVVFAVSAVAAASAGKTTVCHQASKKFVEISVSNNALPAHMAHGDTLPDQYGDCP
jgi:hypothetical protein